MKETLKLLQSQASFDLVCILRSGKHAFSAVERDLKKNGVTGERKIVYFDPHHEPHILEGGPNNSVALIVDDQIATGKRMHQAVEKCLSVGYSPENLLFYVMPNNNLGRDYYLIFFDSLDEFKKKYPKSNFSNDINVDRVISLLS